ncbi:MAG TPA: SDR family NAD(P)-dependent oxidoreductase [Thermoanaerobaculia bacterium]|nr:SDR family NAD(P)-dependent oxidoreductase [Thermoanaerobaculia bacterium]
MRTLLITGATGGLGSEIVPLLSSGYECIALSRSGAGGVKADLSDPASVRSAVRSIGKPVYGLVHLAGGYAPGSIAETTDDTWSSMLALNLTAAFVAVRETLAVMDRDSAGRIVVIGSEASLSKAAGNVAYTVAKSGLNVLIELAAKELRGTPITANALLPTALDTPAMRGAMPREKLVPLSKVGESLLFLLSDAASHISGALIPLSAP